MPRSKAEVRAAHATVEGADTGMSQAYAREVISEMHGRSMASLPEHAAKKPPKTPAVNSEIRMKRHWSGR